jgi:hypothetical protein
MEEEVKKKKAKGAPKSRKGHRSPTLNKRKPRNARKQEKLLSHPRHTLRRIARESRRILRRVKRDGSQDVEHWLAYRKSLREVPRVQEG